MATEFCQLAYEGKLEELKLKLLECGDLIFRKDSSGRLPIHWACSGGCYFVVQFLLENDRNKQMVDLQDESLWTPLIIATSAGSKDIVHHLISVGADVNAINSTGQCSLHYAASKDRVEIAEILLQNGCNPNVSDNVGNTPLHRSACKGNVKMTKLLLSHKADYSRHDLEGNTALHVACEENEGETAKLLVDYGADLTSLNKVGKTPLDLAPLQLQKQLRKFLAR